MTQASGVSKKLVMASQSAKGTIAAAAAADAVYLRRVTSDLDVVKETYESNEIRNDFQVSDMRHGVQSVEGTIAGELSVGSYQLLMGGILRKAWAAGGTTGALTDVAAANTATATGTFTRDAGSFITDGFKLGDVVRWTGFTESNNNTHNFMITALTALVMTVVGLDGVGPTTEAKGDSVTGAVQGKKLWTPTSSHVDTYFTFEHNFSDLDLSELYWDCKPKTMAVKMPATGIATIDWGIVGLRYTDKASGDAPYFSSPAAASTGAVLAAVNGIVYVQNTAVALITGMDFTVDGNQSSEPVIGSNVKPELFNGRVKVNGNMTVNFQDTTFRNYFLNETEVSITAVCTGGNTANASFVAFTMPRVKMGGAKKDDGEKGLVQTMPFVALFNTSGGAAVNTEATTLSIQDSSIA